MTGMGKPKKGQPFIHDEVPWPGMTTDREIDAAAEAIARAMPVGFVVTMEAAREFARAALDAAAKVRSVKP